MEIHDRIASGAHPGKELALTLDACFGKFDDDLIEFLIRNRIPATLFATKRWLVANPLGVSIIKAHLDLFDVERTIYRRLSGRVEPFMEFPGCLTFCTYDVR